MGIKDKALQLLHLAQNCSYWTSIISWPLIISNVTGQVNRQQLHINNLLIHVWLVFCQNHLLRSCHKYGHKNPPWSEKKVNAFHIKRVHKRGIKKLE